MLPTYDDHIVASRSTWKLLPINVWNNLHFNADSQAADCFEAGGPEDIDLVAELGADVGARNKFRSWERSELSDVAGCFLLNNPQHTKPLGAPSGKNCPILGLVDILESRGFVDVDRVVQHSPKKRFIV